MAWKDLSELAPQLTEGEVRFEKKKRVVGLILGPLCFAAALLAPPLEQVTPLGMRTLAVFVLAVVWWISEAVPIPVTSLFVLPLSVILGILPYEKAFSYWSHWTVIFLLGAFILGHAMQLHGLTRRFSLSLVASRLIGGSPWRLLVFFLTANAIVTGFISNSVSAVLFLSMGLGLLEILRIQPGSAYGMALFLGVAWATNIGGILTPSGTPTNMIAIGLAQPMGYRVGYLQWIITTFPFTLAQMVAMFAVLRWFIPREELSGVLDREGIRAELRRLGPFSRGEKFAAWTLAVTLFFWILPDIAPLFLGPRHPVSVWLLARLNWAVVALLIPFSLFLLPTDWKARKFAMTWDEAVRNIEWGTMALVAGALAMGEMVASREYGLGAFFATSISSVAGPETSRYVFLLIAITLAVALTNLATNVAVISIMGPIALTVAPGLGLNPIALTVTLSIASCIGYSTPMANPPCAIVFASGYIRILPMFQRGLILSGIGIILLSLVGYPVADRLLPWPVATP